MANRNQRFRVTYTSGVTVIEAVRWLDALTEALNAATAHGGTLLSIEIVRDDDGKAT